MGPKRHQWRRQGVERRFVSVEQFPGRADGIEAFSFDGEKAYDLFPAENGRPPHILISERFNQGYENAYTPERAIGLRLDLAEMSLPEAWRAGRVESVDDEAVGGVACHKVDLSGFATSRGTPLRLTAWIDPTHGHMPRRLSVRYADPQNELEGQAHFTWETEEFFAVPDPFDSESHWFPRRAVFRQMTPESKLMLVERAVINESMPAERFRPAPPPGTQVSDVTDPARQRHFVVGGLAAARKYTGRLVERAVDEAARPTAGVSAVPAKAIPPDSNWSQLVFWISGLLVLLGVALWMVRRT